MTEVELAAFVQKTSMSMTFVSIMMIVIGLMLIALGHTVYLMQQEIKELRGWRGR